MAFFVFGGIAAGAIALLLPLRWLLIGLFVTSFVVIGQIVYFGGISKAIWIPFLAGLLLLVRLPIDAMQRNRSDAVHKSSGSMMAMKVSIALFFGTLLATTLINASPPIQILITSKEYVFLWSVYLILAAGLVRTALVERIWASLPWLMVLQVPLILYQRFIVMSKTHAQARWDVIVGAFGGNPDGGGLSGAMGFFCLIGIVTAIVRFQSGLIPRWQMLVLVVSGLLAIALAEVKFMILLLPVCFGFVFMRQLRQRPVKSVMLTSLGVILAVGVMFGYKLQFDPPYKKRTMEQYFEEMFVAQADSVLVNQRNRAMGRVEALVFWYKQQGSADPIGMLVGNGAGSSRIAMTFIGEAQEKYVQRLARSTLAILLWETGILGTLAYLAMLCFAWLALRKRATEPHRSAESRTTLQSMSAAILLLAASLPYDQNLLFSHQLQLLLLVSMGYVALIDRLSRVKGGSSIAAIQDLTRLGGSEPLPTISIVIKALNEETKIGRCIESAVAALGELPNPSEIVLADSVSTDRTVEIARRYPVRIVQFQHASERGCGAAVQLGYQHSRGDFVMLLDGDMELLPGFLPFALKKLAREPSLAGVAGLVEDTSIKNAFDRRRVATGAINRPLRAANWLSGGGLYRRDAILDAGGYRSICSSRS